MRIESKKTGAGILLTILFIIMTVVSFFVTLFFAKVQTPGMALMKALLITFIYVLYDIGFCGNYYKVVNVVVWFYLVLYILLSCLLVVLAFFNDGGDYIFIMGMFLISLLSIGMYILLIIGIKQHKENGNTKDWLCLSGIILETLTFILKTIFNYMQTGAGIVELVNGLIGWFIEVVIFVWLTYPDIFHKTILYPLPNMQQLSNLGAKTVTETSNRNRGKFEELKTYKDMLDSGLITEEDYEKKKNEVLSK